MSSSVVQILVIFGLILLNGVFSMSEIALVSARKGRLKQKAEDGDHSAQRVLKLLENPNQFLSAVQIGITTIGILSGALGGATLTTALTEVLVKWGIKSSLAEEVALSVIIILTTYFSLVIGELIPKRLGMKNPEKISQQISGFMIFLSKSLAPIVKFLGWSTETGLKILGVTASDGHDVSEEEIRSMLLEGTEVGVFEESEHDMVEGVFRLGDRRVDRIVTPRTELEWINLQDPIESWDQIIFNTRFNQIPVVEGELDQVVGVIRTRDLLKKRLMGEPFDPTELVLPALFIPESMPALTALQLIKENSSNMAMVIDEYGGLLGIVTLFDVLEAIIGDIKMSDTSEEGSIVERTDGSWLIDGLLAVDELKEFLSLNEFDGEGEFGYQTLGGLMMAHMGKIPKTGQSFELNGFRFEVVDMDEKRVDKVIVTRLAPQQAGAQDHQQMEGLDADNQARQV